MVHVFNKYILSKSEAFQPESILQLIQSSHCTQQQNMIDCALFAIAVCFHILEGKPVDESILEQEHITELQHILPSLLNQKKNDKIQETVLNNFPKLNTNNMPLTNASSLLCDENFDLTMSTGPSLTLRTGHPYIDP